MTLDFEKLSFENIVVLTKTFISTSRHDVEIIEQYYCRFAPYFIETLSFLEYLGLLRREGTTIIASPEYDQVINTSIENNALQECLKELLINKLIFQPNSHSLLIDDFLSLCIQSNKRGYEHLLEDRLKFSGLRNLLLGLDLIVNVPEANQYLITEKYFLRFIDKDTVTKLSAESLDRILEYKKEIGKLAELEILKYERERLLMYPSIVDQIEYSAETNVRAGYDIKSFSVIDGSGNDCLPRFIEVKAVSGTDCKFYWTRNELEMAREHKNQYFLYLLPVRANKQFDLKSLKIVPNPIEQIFENSTMWIRTEEVISFTLKH